MRKEYLQPDLEVKELTLTEITLASLPVNNPSEYEVPILTRMKDDLAGGDGLSELPTEVPDDY